MKALLLAPIGILITLGFLAANKAAPLTVYLYAGEDDCVCSLDFSTVRVDEVILPPCVSSTDLTLEMSVTEESTGTCSIANTECDIAAPCTSKVEYIVSWPTTGGDDIKALCGSTENHLSLSASGNPQDTTVAPGEIVAGFWSTDSTATFNVNCAIYVIIYMTVYCGDGEDACGDNSNSTNYLAKQKKDLKCLRCPVDPNGS